MKLSITISPTTDGVREYIQILSDDATTVNVVLVVDKIDVHDVRARRLPPPHKVEE